jgi:thiol-disulfide isomerase/thioredoxin
MITHIEKYGAQWCSPCRALDRTLAQITEVDVIKYDVDEHEDLIASKKIRNVPVLIFYDGDKEVDRLIGAVSLKTINETIDKWK